jgi:hypothetical protein
MNGDEPDVVVGLSPPVRQAVGEAVKLVESLVSEMPGGLSLARRSTWTGEEVSP